MKKLFTLLLTTLLPLMASADPVKIGGIYYDLTSGETNTATVTSNPDKYSGNVAIPVSVVYNEVTYDVTAIGERAFDSCDGLTYVSIPNSVTSIGDDAFSACSSLTYFFCYAENVPETSANAFDGSNISNATLFVPMNSYDAYKAAAPWKDFKEIEAICSLDYNEVGGYYVIGSANDMDFLSKLINKYDPEHIWSKMSYKVTVDELDFSGNVLEPIGNTSDYSFGGQFDGQGVVIKNVTVARTDTYGNVGGGNVIGLFAYAQDATIKNIIMDESCKILGNNSVGSLIGISTASSVINCINKANVTGRSYVGGVVGQSKTLKVQGRIVGHSLISNCLNKGIVCCNVINGDHLGGIVGGNDTECEIVDCENHGQIIKGPDVADDDHYGDYMGGIVGYNLGVVRNCVNTSDIVSKGQDVAGISGHSDNNGEIHGCRNSGNISSEGYYVGGIVGCVMYTVVSDCVNTGHVSSSVNGAGGITGYIYRCTIKNCTTKDHKVQGTYNVGALFGSYDYNYSPVWDNYYYDDVEVIATVGTYNGDQARGVGDKKDKEPKDINEIVVDHVTYYNGAAMMLRDEKVTITTSQYGKTTYCGSKNLDFSGLDQVKAYVATGYEYQGETSVIWMTRVTDVPAGTPIVVKGELSTTYKIPVKAYSAAYYKNLLVRGAGESLNATDGAGHRNYVMSGGKFVAVGSDPSIPIGTNKCYLQLPETMNPTVAGAAQSLTLSATGTGKTTYCAPVDLDFTDVEDLIAYSATGYDNSTGTIWLTRVKKVSAGEGLLLKGTKGESYTIPSVGIQSYYANMIVGNNGTSGVTINPTDGEFTNYVLSGGKFVALGESTNIPVGKAYLQIPSVVLTRAADAALPEFYDLSDDSEVISMVVSTRGIGSDNNTTGIKEVNSEGVNSEEWYNLNGQRVEKPGKGLYIHNGKTVMIK